MIFSGLGTELACELIDLSLLFFDGVYAVVLVFRILDLLIQAVHQILQSKDLILAERILGLLVTDLFGLSVYGLLSSLHVLLYFCCKLHQPLVLQYRNQQASVGVPVQFLQALYLLHQLYIRLPDRVQICQALLQTSFFKGQLA